MKRFSLVFLSFITFPALAGENDHALVDPNALEFDQLVYLEQNWTEKERQFFYFTDQGSRFMDYAVFINLEQPGSSELFKDPLHLMKYGYLPAPVSRQNPDGLPVGFTRYGGSLGYTCAACHTQNVRYKDRTIRIDGGQAMADFQAYRVDLEQALAETLVDKTRMDRFLKRADENSGVEPDEARKRLAEAYRYLKDYNYRNHTAVPYGYSRLDAFGAILNKGLFLTGVKDNFNPPDAPTSYPYLWDTPQHDYVEWNGSQANSSVGALARNVGEVIGVFGDVDVTPRKRLFFFDGGYTSSIQARNLRKLEMLIARLQSPRWPESFPAINTELAATGRPLYAKYCLACHQDIDRKDPDRRIQVRMSTLPAIQTDPLMARNALDLKGKTGIFRGKPRFYAKGELMGEEAPALFVVNNIMVGVLKNNLLQTLLAKRDSRKLGHPDVIHPPKYVDGEIIEHGQEVSERALLAYKARPLNGIWAGAPYLHNGSVPNLYQLLLPASDRDKGFFIGSWEFDPVRVGYVSDRRPGSFLFNTTLPGNSNAGHEYGTGTDGLPALTEEEIWALVEYMKTL